MRGRACSRLLTSHSIITALRWSVGTPSGPLSTVKIRRKWLSNKSSRPASKISSKNEHLVRWTLTIARLPVRRALNPRVPQMLKNRGSSLSSTAILSSSATFSLRLWISTTSCCSTRTNPRCASSARSSRTLAVIGSGSTSRNHSSFRWASLTRKRSASTPAHFSKSSSASSTSPSRH